MADAVVDLPVGIGDEDRAAVVVEVVVGGIDDVVGDTANGAAVC